MKNAVLSRFLTLALALSVSLPLGVAPAAAQDNCWDNSAIQAAVSEGRIRSLAAVLAREGIGSSTEVLSVRVCEQGGAPVYVLQLLEASGQTRILTASAQ